MTLPQIQAIVADIRNKSADLEVASRELLRFADEVGAIIQSSYAGTINVDSFYALQTPVYTAKKSDIQAKFLLLP